MSHIPNSAMKHAGPTHHDDGAEAHHDAPSPKPAKPAPPARAGRDAGAARPGTGAWVALGGVLVAGAAAAIAVPLLRARSAPVPKRRGKRAAVRKGKGRSAGK